MRYNHKTNDGRIITVKLNNINTRKYYINKNLEMLADLEATLKEFGKSLLKNNKKIVLIFK